VAQKNRAQNLPGDRRQAGANNGVAHHTGSVPPLQPLMWLAGGTATS